jgi:hypothetical protein
VEHNYLHRVLLTVGGPTRSSFAAPWTVHCPAPKVDNIMRSLDIASGPAFIASITSLIPGRLPLELDKIDRKIRIRCQLGLELVSVYQYIEVIKRSKHRYIPQSSITARRRSIIVV